MKKVLLTCIITALLGSLSLFSLEKDLEPALEPIAVQSTSPPVDWKCRFLSCACKPKEGFICENCASCQQD